MSATRVRGMDTPHVLNLVITDMQDITDDIEIQSPLGKSDHAVLKTPCKISLCISELVNSTLRKETMMD